MNEHGNVTDESLDHQMVLNQKELWERKMNRHVWFFTLLLIFMFVAEYSIVRERVREGGLLQFDNLISFLPVILSLIGAFLLSQKKKSGWILLMIFYCAGAIYLYLTVYVIYDSKGEQTYFGPPSTMESVNGQKSCQQQTLWGKLSG